MTHQPESDSSFTNDDIATDGRSGAPAGNRSKALPWYLTLPVVTPALIFAYPLGLALLFRRPRRRRALRWAGAIVSLPIFLLFVLVLLRDYWEFGGGMTLSSFRLDFSRGRVLDARIDAHRATQATAAPRIDAERLAGLNWPAFRGALRDGVVSDAAITTDWQADPPREMWRVPVGEGYSSVVLKGDRLYTLEQRHGREVLSCYDAGTGYERWATPFGGYFREPLGGDGPRSTPTLDGDRIYALGAEGALLCASADRGEPIWARDILMEFNAENLQWGLSCSPLVVDDLVIVTNSGRGGGSLLAYRKGDGAPVWQSDLGQQGYSSPIVATLRGRRQLLNLAGYHMNGVDPQTGRLLWAFPWATSLGISCSQPIVVDESHVFISLGYGVGCAMLEVKQTGYTLTAEPKWSNLSMKNKFTSSVLYKGALYGLDENILACVDAATGDRHWKGGRYGYGSVLLVGDYLLVSGEYGELILVRATTAAHEELAQIQILHEKTWNNAALTNGLLFARSHKQMVCYDLRPTK